MRLQFTTRVIILMFVITVASLSVSFLSTLKGDKVPQQEVLSQSEETDIAKLLESNLVEGVDSIVGLYHTNYQFSGKVMVNYKGQMIYKNGVGYANPKKGTPIDSAKPYQLASVSKQFTAVAIMMLEKEGRLNYDDRVTEYFPKFPYEAVTIKHLLNHTAGLPNYMWLLEHKYPDDKKAYNDDVINLLAENEFLNFRPGSRFHYSNTGYVVLATIVEKVTGQSFGEFLDQQVFEPLDMENTFVYSAALDKNYPEKMNGYRKSGYYYHKVSETVHDGVVGDKGIYSTAEDLFKWDQALYNQTLIDQNQLEKAFNRVRLMNGYQIDYGYGFRIEERNGKKVVYHNGLWNGFRTSFKRHIEDTISVVVLNNTDSRVKGDLVRSLERYLQNNAQPSKLHSLVMKTIKKSSDGAIDKLKALKTDKPDWLDQNKLKRVIQYLERNKKPRMAKKLKKLYSQIDLVMAKNKEPFERTSVSSSL